MENPMPTTGITWIAHRVQDHASLASARLLADALGLSVLIDDGEKLMLQTTGGDIVEYCTPAANVPEHLFRDQSVVSGYLVDDLAASAEALGAAGFSPLTPPTDGGPVVFQHFRGVDGDVFGLIMPAGAQAVTSS